MLSAAADPAADADLLRRFVAHADADAFASIVRRHARGVWAVCRNSVPAEADAEDAFQATFLALVRHAGRVRNPDALAGWLHGVAVKVCAKLNRTAARRNVRERRAAVAEAGTSVADSAWDAVRAAVHEEVRFLPDRERVPFVLCCLEGVGVTAAAAQLGWKLGTLSGRLTRAKARLLARLAERGVLPAAVAVVAGAAGGPPAAAVQTALRFGTPGGAAAGAKLLSLVTGVTGMGVLRTKILLGGAMLTAAVGVMTWTGHEPAARGQSADVGKYQEKLVEVFDDRLKTALDVSPPASPAAKWEYKIVMARFAGIPTREEAVFNELGAAGWELATASGDAYTFKRPKDGARGAAQALKENARLGALSLAAQRKEAAEQLFDVTERLRLTPQKAPPNAVQVFPLGVKGTVLVYMAANPGEKYETEDVTKFESLLVSGPADGIARMRVFVMNGTGGKAPVVTPPSATPPKK